ncbi:MAG: ABC transporter substrate-binding protein [Nitrososphaerota archaeon]
MKTGKNINIVWLAVALVVGIIIGALGYYVVSFFIVPQKPLSLVDTIKSRGKLIVGTSADWPPFEYIDAQGNFAGIDIVLAEKIAKALNVKLEIKDMKFAALIEALKGGQIDLILADMHITAEREKEVDFSKEYYIAYECAIVTLKNKASQFIDIPSLYGKNIGVQLGTIQEEWANNNLKDKASIISYDRVYPEMVMTLKRGDLDAIVVGDIIATVLERRDPDLIVAKRVGSLAGAAVAVPQGAEDLKYVVNKVIEDLIKSGEMEQIFQEEIGKWLGE